MSGRYLSAAVLLAFLSACSGPTAPSAAQIEQSRASWETHNLDRYAYQLEYTGFLSALANRAMRLVVLNDTVRSAQFVGTWDSVPVIPSTLPTIEQLFIQAVDASNAGRLTAFEVDSTFSYPTLIGIAGPPDASGTILASSLELLP